MNRSSVITKATAPPLKDSDFRSEAVVIIQGTLFAILGAIIVLGNLACIVTFLKTQSLRRRSHYLIISLSFADLLVGVTELMFLYSVITGPKDDPFHLSLNVIDSLTGHASVFTLTVINVERFYAVYFPFRHRVFTFKFYVMCASLPWIVAVIIASLCLIAKIRKGILSIIYLYQQAFFASVAIIVIVVSCVCIFVKIKKNNAVAMNQNRTLRERRLVVTLLIVTLASLLTWLPHQCWMFAAIFCRICGSIQIINYHITIKFLQYLNSGINVFIYIARMPEFRVAFRMLFFRNRREQTSRQSVGMVASQARENVVMAQTQNNTSGDKQLSNFAVK